MYFQMTHLLHEHKILTILALWVVGSFPLALLVGCLIRAGRVYQQ